jgi:two-component system sensor histidine kinase AlgZ
LRRYLPAPVYALLVVAAVALGIAVLVLVQQGFPWGRAARVAFVPALLFGAIGMASRYACRAVPLAAHSIERIVVTHAGAAVAAGGLWIVVWQWWLRFLGRDPIEVSTLFGAGALLYGGIVAVHYLTLETEAARRAEAAALRYEVLAREAELKAFKAQIDPHFLFNSLNAIAALCGPDSRDARRMTQLLAEFFRQTLRVASFARIPLGQELELASRYVAIEQVRFGRRLEVAIEADDAARAVEVPPLLLQPLVENAVRHGIASMVEGGCVRVTAERAGDVLRIAFTNPADPERSESHGEGIGLQNARGRLDAMFSGRASLRASETEGTYRVEIELPS